MFYDLHRSQHVFSMFSEDCYVAFRDQEEEYCLLADLDIRACLRISRTVGPSYSHFIFSPGEQEQLAAMPDEVVGLFSIEDVVKF